MESSTTTPSFPPDSSKDLDPQVHQSAVLRDPQDVENNNRRAELERKLLRQLDLRMSMFMLMYGIIYVDRMNIAAVRLRGFEKDLHMHGQQFATVLATFHIGLFVMPVPGNMFLHHLAKSTFLSGSMLVWGLLAVLLGTFASAVVLRVASGFVEAAFFPGVLLVLSKWYKRTELGVRIGMLGAGIWLSMALGIPISVAVLDTMDGVLGHAAWRWVFFLQGALMLLVSICGFFVLPDFPATTTARWLGDEQRRLAIKRMKEDAGVGDEKQTAEEASGGVWWGLKLALSDWTVWLVAVAYMATCAGTSFTSYWPTLITGMGFSPTAALLLCAPPLGFAGISMLIVSRYLDKTEKRFWCIFGNIVCTIVGCLIAIFTTNAIARYCATFLMAQYGVLEVLFITWVIDAFLQPPSKRAVVLAIVHAFCQAGSMAGSYMFPPSWGPSYRKSFEISTALLSCMLLMCYIFKLHLARLNTKLEKEKEEKEVKFRGFRYMM